MMLTKDFATTSVGLLLILAACGGNRASPEDADAAGVEQVGDGISGVQEVACSTHAVWPVPACAPSCSSGRFHVELPANDEYPEDRVLFLPDGRTLVAQSAFPDGSAGQVRLVLLSGEGKGEDTATVEPCGEPVEVDLMGLEAGDNGEFLLLAVCSPWSDGQRTLVVRLDAQLGLAETREVLSGAQVKPFSLSMATLDGVLHLLAVVAHGDGENEVSEAVLVTNPTNEDSTETEIVGAVSVSSVGPLIAEDGRLVVTLEKEYSDDPSEERSAVLVLDGTGTVLLELDGRRYSASGDLDYRPFAAHMAGGDLVIAGESWDLILGPEGWPSNEAVVERRKLDGTLVTQTRFPTGRWTNLRGLVPMPASVSDPSAAAWLLLLAEREYVKSIDGFGSQVLARPRFTWLTPGLEARFGIVASEEIPEMPMVLAPACDCGYRIAWTGKYSLHVAGTNNLFRQSQEAPCDDGWPCTTDRELNGSCTFEVSAGCTGPDGCYEAGAPRSDNPCLVCGQSETCDSLWQTLVDKASCGLGGECQAGRCVCEGRWIAVKGSSFEMHTVLAAGLQADGHVLAWTRATQVQTYPQGKLHGLDISANGDAVDLGSVADSWFESAPLLVAEEATYAAVDGKLKQLDRSGATAWATPLPPWQPQAPDNGALGIVQPAPDKVMAFYVGRNGQSLEFGASLCAADGTPLADGFWTKSFAELEGEIELANPLQRPEDRGIQALALPDGRVLVLVGATQFPSGSDIGTHHEFLILLDKNGEDATFKVLPKALFAAAMAFGKDTFLTCRDLEIQEWTLEGEKKGLHMVAAETTAGKEETRSCLGLAPGSDGGVRMLVRTLDKISHVEYGEVLLLGLDWRLQQKIRMPVVPDWNGLRALPDGGFLVTGSLDSGVAVVLRADADGHYRCW